MNTLTNIYYPSALHQYGNAEDDGRIIELRVPRIGPTGRRQWTDEAMERYPFYWNEDFTARLYKIEGDMLHVYHPNDRFDIARSLCAGDYEIVLS